jgi:hypothetical protein
VRKAPGADALAEMGDGLRVAEEILEAHGLSLVHLSIGLQRSTGAPRFDGFLVPITRWTQTLIQEQVHSCYTAPQPET